MHLFLLTFQVSVQVVDKVVSRMHALGISASKAIEFLHDVDFPSKMHTGEI